MSEWHPQVVRIAKLDPHPNADSLSVTHVLGAYPVVVQTAAWKVGDLAAYIPVDTLVPNRAPFKFLFPDDAPVERVKAKRLRGILSMGLLVPAPEGVGRGASVIESMGLRKYERAIPASMQGVSLNDPMFNLMPKYDIEGLRAWPSAFTPGEKVVVTEKLHGANCRYRFSKGELLVGSRSRTLQTGSSVWWRMAEKYDLAARLRHHPDWTFYAEVFGAGIQDLRYDRTEPELRFFDIRPDYTTPTGFLDYDEFKAICQGLGLPVAPQLWSGGYNPDKIAALAEGKSTLADHVREGVVIRPERERWEQKMGGRAFLKLHGEGFLTRKQAA